MSEARERSGIFKFFYIVLSIVTFPIFAIIYILKHPLWVLFFVLLALGVLVYFPMSDGVEISGVVDWYKKKYSDVRLEVVTKAVESGKTNFVPKSVIEDVERIKQEAEEEKKESLRVKGENYNDKIIRDKEFESVAVEIKKKKGFVKKEVISEVDKNAKSLVEEGKKAGGLSDILKNATKKTEEKNEYIDESLGDINDVLDSLDNVASSDDDLGLKNDEAENNEDINDDVDKQDDLEIDDNKEILDELQKVDDKIDEVKEKNEGLPDINNLVVDLPVVENKLGSVEDKSVDGNLELF